MITSAESLDLVTRGAALCSTIMAAEALVERRHYRDEGLMGWPVMRSRSRRLAASWYSPALDALMSFRPFLALNVLRTVAALALLTTSPQGGWRVALLCTLAVTTMLFNARTSFGTDGADQMHALTLIVLAMEAITHTPLVRVAVLWFIALELAVSYLAAGLWKLRGADWREGRAAWLILATRTYGLPAFGLWLKNHPYASLAMSWAVIVFECIFPVVFVAPAPLALALIIGGIGFHLFNATVMGLNTFLLAFLSCYPALAYCVFGAVTS